MFEARLEQGQILKKIIDAIKDLVAKVNLDTSLSGISLQAMDSSHVALVALNLKETGFARFRSDKPTTLGLDIGNLSKIMKCAGNDDIITMKAEEDPSTISFVFENNSMISITLYMKLTLNPYRKRQDF